MSSRSGSSAAGSSGGKQLGAAGGLSKRGTSSQSAAPALDTAGQASVLQNPSNIPLEGQAAHDTRKGTTRSPERAASSSPARGRVIETTTRASGHGPTAARGNTAATSTGTSSIGKSAFVAVPAPAARAAASGSSPPTAKARRPNASRSSSENSRSAVRSQLHAALQRRVRVLGAAYQRDICNPVIALKVIIAIDSGMWAAEIEELLHVPELTVHRWKEIFHGGGFPLRTVRDEERIRELKDWHRSHVLSGDK